jgi:uncharacterized protein YrrD
MLTMEEYNLKKAKGLLGLPLILMETGKEIGGIRAILFSQEKKKVLGFLIDEGGWFKGAKIILFKDIYKIGKDAVIINNKEVIMSSAKIPEVEKILENKYHLFEMQVLDDNGNNIGHIENIIFDDKNGKILSLEVSEGTFEDVINGRLNILISKDVKLEKERVIVSSNYIRGISKSGGLKKYFSDKEKN